MKEQWSRWEPIQGLAAKYSVQSIVFDLQGLRLNLCEDENSRNMVSVKFTGLVGSYKWTDETFRLETVSFLDEEYGSTFYGKWTFFKVTNSPYLELLSKESCTIADSRNFMHFAFIDSNSIVDIIASYEPKVELFEK